MWVVDVLVRHLNSTMEISDSRQRIGILNRQVSAAPALDCLVETLKDFDLLLITVLGQMRTSAAHWALWRCRRPEVVSSVSVFMCGAASACGGDLSGQAFLRFDLLRWLSSRSKRLQLRRCFFPRRINYRFYMMKNRLMEKSFQFVGIVWGWIAYEEFVKCGKSGNFSFLTIVKQ